MQLYERIKEVCVILNVSQTSLASELGLSQSRFNQYLNIKSQKNLWDYLPQILNLFPQLNRNWLYFGEGEMTGNACPHVEDILEEKKELQQKLTAIEKKLEEEQSINKKLINRLLLEGSPQYGSEGGQTGEAAG